MWEEMVCGRLVQDIVLEPDHGDGEEEAGSRETEVEASLFTDLADGRAMSGFVTLVM